MFTEFGIDGNGDEGWSDEERENIENFGDVSRYWFFDEEFNSKPAKWVTENDDNFSKAPKQIHITCNTQEEGIEIMFIGWREIKEFILKND